MAERAAVMRRHGVVDRPGTDAAAAATVRTALATFVFAVALAVLVVGPPLLPQPFGPYPLLTIGMVLDLLTPIVLIPIGWWLFRRASGARMTTAATLLFIGLAAVLVEGQAIHLAANAIGEHLAGPGDAARLTHDLDELVSHLIWHGALVGLSAVIILASARRPMGPASGVSRWLLAGGAVVYGATFFLMVVEGGTGLIGVPSAAAIGVAGLWATRANPLRWGAGSTFVVGYALATVLFVVWAAMNGWTLPEFSDVGLL